MIETTGWVLSLDCRDASYNCLVLIIAVRSPVSFLIKY